MSATQETKRDPRWIDVRNDAWMVIEGLRLPKVTQNPEWHRKTEEEKAAVKNFVSNKGWRTSKMRSTPTILEHRIVIYCKKPVGNKTTFSAVLKKEEALAYVESLNIPEGVIKSIYFNGKPLNIL